MDTFVMMERWDHASAVLVLLCKPLCLCTCLSGVVHVQAKCQAGADDTPASLLEGHLSITSELISLQTPDIKLKIGSDPTGHRLIEVGTAAV